MMRRSLSTRLSNASFVSNYLRLAFLRRYHFLLADHLYITFKSITIVAPIHHRSPLHSPSFQHYQAPSGQFHVSLSNFTTLCPQLQVTLVCHPSSTPQLQHLIFSTRLLSHFLRLHHIVLPSHLIFDSFTLIFHYPTQYKEHPLSWRELGAK
jgi:hypothetical protein